MTRRRRDWSAGEQTRLERYAVEGLTAAQIAQELGRTRNSVIGRIDRTDVVLVRSAHSPGARAKRRADAHSLEAFACAA